MRYPLSEKLEIIRLVERSHLPAKRTLAQLGIPRTSFYRWYDRCLTGGPEALEDRRSRPGQVWNRIPDEVRDRIVQLALDETDLSPRELAVRFTDTEGYFVSESSVYVCLSLTSSGPGGPRSIPSQMRASGPPVSCTRIAWIIPACAATVKAACSNEVSAKSNHSSCSTLCQPVLEE